jgi:hypothetical protein
MIAAALWPFHQNILSVHLSVIVGGWLAQDERLKVAEEKRRMQAELNRLTRQNAVLEARMARSKAEVLQDCLCQLPSVAVNV